MAFSESIIKVTQFGSTVLDPNLGSSLNYTLGSGKADLGLIRLPNQATYDPNGAFDAPILPGNVSFDFVVTATDTTTLITQLQTLTQLVGKRDTLTGKTINNDEWTCTARLHFIDGMITPPQDNLNQLIKFNFVQITVWEAS